MAIDPKRTAVVLIEFQNDFTSEGGALHGAVAGVMESTGMLENTRRLVERARRMKSRFVVAKVSSPRLPSTTTSPSCGASASTISAPHSPLTNAVESTTPFRIP